MLTTHLSLSHGFIAEIRSGEEDRPAPVVPKSVPLDDAQHDARCGCEACLAAWRVREDQGRSL